MSAMTVRVRDLAGTAEWSAASALYRLVFGYTDPVYGLSPRLLAALHENAGSVIGAFDPAGELVGFCFGFTAVDDGEIYHYSQAAVVHPSAQGTGVGRLLKHAQAGTARATGARTMRWTFDPYAVRNAHFNLTVLGATGIRFLPDYYGPGTDRILVSWDLTGPPAPRPIARTVSATGRDELRDRLAGAFAAGGRLVGVDRDPVAYHFAEDS